MSDCRGYVYLIGSHTFHWYKIGKSKTPCVRLKTIGILLPFKIELIALWKCWSPSVESHIHEKCANKKINGEWFSFTRSELTKVVSEPLWNATLVAPLEFADPSSLTKFTNIEREAPAGQKLRVRVSVVKR